MPTQTASIQNSQNAASGSSILLHPMQANRPSGLARKYSETLSSIAASGRRRRSSSLMYTEPPESLEQLSDQSTLGNLNADWVNAKGAWVVHFVIIACLKVFYDIIPLPVTQEISWTMTNITYVIGSYIMFHWVRGVPFEFNNAGAYDNLNMWEQIDDGHQYTPAKKFLLSVPIILFLVSTHYTHYDMFYFTLNFLATLMVVIPKLPQLHRLRLAIFSGLPEDREEK